MKLLVSFINSKDPFVHKYEKHKNVLYFEIDKIMFSFEQQSYTITGPSDFLFASPFIEHFFPHIALNSFAIIKCNLNPVWDPTISALVRDGHRKVQVCIIWLAPTCSCSKFCQRSIIKYFITQAMGATILNGISIISKKNLFLNLTFDENTLSVNLQLGYSQPAHWSSLVFTWMAFICALSTKKIKLEQF